MSSDDRRDPRTHATHPDSCRCLMCVVWGKDPRRPGVYRAGKKPLADCDDTGHDDGSKGDPTNDQ